MHGCINTGPLGSFHFDKAGTGVHDNTHGPWKAEQGRDWWFDYFDKDDSMFKAEAGAPGASSLDILEKYLLDKISLLLHLGQASEFDCYFPQSGALHM